MHDDGRLQSSAGLASPGRSAEPDGPEGEASAEMPRDAHRLKRRDLANLLNLVHFREGTVFVRFQREEGDEGFYLKARPLPSDGEALSCLWASKIPRARELSVFGCRSLLISDGRVHVAVPVEVLELDERGIVMRMPKPGSQVSARDLDRYPGNGVRVRILQSGMSYEGDLEDFNGVSLGVRLDVERSASRNWLNPAQEATVLLFREGGLIFSGECGIAGVDRGASGTRLVLTPIRSNIQRFKPREYRCHRRELSPPPAIRFTHPLSGQTVYLKTEDVSGMGLCVEEFFEQSSLIPGMIIEDLSVELAGNVLLGCRAQVLYSNVLQKADGRKVSRSGLVFLDLEPDDQVRLSSAVHSSIDGRLSVCGRVEMEELWRFFFESGFIYPSKYLSLQAHKDEFTRTYEKLYLESPSIARHFFFRDRGRILGHMSMLRFYPESWLIHHHAASRDGHGPAGVSVLDEAGRFTSDFHLHPGAHMDYLMCYYRPENRFPARVFGGVVRDIADSKGASVDAFSYLRLPAPSDPSRDAFQLFPSRPEDLAELARRYDETSGGLALNGLSLAGPGGSDAELSEEYRRQGFKRDRQIYSLRREGRLEAVIQVAVSDIGLNLSNLTNCMHVFVLEPEGLEASALFTALDALRGHFSDESPPVLVYPGDYLDRYSVPYEKKYMLWVLDTGFSDGYFESVRNTFRRSCREQEDRRPAEG